MQWQLHDDGSFDVQADGLTVRGCYPAIDGVAVRPLAVEVHRRPEGGTVGFRLPFGRLDVHLGRHGETLTLAARLADCRQAPHWIEPLAAGRVEGLDRFFRQGLGIGGPTLFVHRDEIGSGRLDSYTVSALVAPDDWTLSVAALDHRRFIQRTTLTAGANREEGLRLAAGFRTERIPLPAATLDLPELTLRQRPQPWPCLRETAEAIGRAMGCRTHQPTSYHWCSWYYLYHNLTEAILDEYLAAFRKITPPVRLDAIQIDAGYFPAAGDWLQTTPYWPSGLEAAVRKIAAAGYRPGVWIGPYMVGNRSRLFAEHPDWLLRAADGALLAPWRRYNEPKPWGYRDEETHVLDTSHPEAMAYLRQVFRTFRQWGVTFYKTDFMLWGLQDSTQVQRFQPGRTSVEYMRDLLAAIREAIGEESFWLGCIAPYGPFLGYADAMRIGGDVGARWQKEGFGPWNMIRETQGTQYFNNVWWQNDPDAILLRDRFIFLDAVEVRSLALWQGILGGVINTSDPLHEIGRDRLDLWRFLEPGRMKWTARLPYLGRRRRLLVAVREFPDRPGWAVLAFNPDDEPHTEVVPLADVTALAEGHVWVWGPGSAEPLGRQRRLVPELAAHASRLYYVSAEDRPPSAGLTLGGHEAA